jgi:N-carbamoyl-L-amino-acid hydrolase
MHSGPGHDAQYVADILPTAMIFVPSVDGHSHCELEYTPVEDCARGVNVLIQALLALDQKLD